jgi:hypothetical protein
MGEKMKRLVAISAILILSSEAMADVEIRMQPGSQCWSYQGRDTSYYGNFSGGQDITVAVVEQFERDIGGMKAVASNEDRVWVNGPAGYFKGGGEPNDKDRFIVTEKTGRYIFNLYEHGIGAEYPVYVRICAAKKSA